MYGVKIRSSIKLKNKSLRLKADLLHLLIQIKRLIIPFLETKFEQADKRIKKSIPLTKENDGDD